MYEGLLFLESSKPPVGENMQKQSNQEMMVEQLKGEPGASARGVQNSIFEFFRNHGPYLGGGQ